MTLAGGYLSLGRFAGSSVRVHWTAPLGAFFLSGARFAPVAWFAALLLILVHELGHAVLVKRYGLRVIAIDVHGLGGECRWAGSTTETQRAKIAWGGVLAQGVVLVAAYVTGPLALRAAPSLVVAMVVVDVLDVWTVRNLFMIGLNLIPFPPLDGAEAWKLFFHRGSWRGGNPIRAMYLRWKLRRMEKRNKPKVPLRVLKGGRKDDSADPQRWN